VKTGFNINIWIGSSSQELLRDDKINLSILILSILQMEAETGKKKHEFWRSYS